MNPPPRQPPPPESYDVVRYPPVVHSQTHPDRLFVIATLFNMRPPPMQRCRVLELGCGDGSNLAAIAFALPGSECVGIDTSAAAIADGQSVARQLGLGNLALHQMDVMQVTRDLGEFDYVIAHGLYSWVPPHVREKVLAVAKENLSPDGVAYVSYNVYPAGHFRQMLRGMMRYHAARFGTPREQIAQAKGLLKFIADSPPPGADEERAASGVGAASTKTTRHELYRQLVRVELDRLGRMPEGFLFHDDLATYNDPVYFHQFAERAAAHGLQYLSEADFFETQPPVRGAPTSMPPDVLRMLDQLPDGDVIAREQYADFIKCRQFRQTLLCHASVRPERPPTPTRVRTLYASTAAKPLSASPDVRSHAVEQFATPRGGGAVSAGNPAAKAALLELATASPGRLHFDELLERGRRRTGTGDGAAARDADVQAVAELLLAGYAANLIALHAYAPEVAIVPGERPVASRLARWQAARGGVVSNLVGASVELSGHMAPRLLQLLDGTRDRAAIAADLAAECRRSGIGVEKAGRRMTDEREMAAALREDLDAKLQNLARLALLVP